MMTNSQAKKPVTQRTMGFKLKRPTPPRSLKAHRVFEIYQLNTSSPIQIVHTNQIYQYCILFFIF